MTAIRDQRAYLRPPLSTDRSMQKRFLHEVAAILRSGEFVSGPRVERFEQQFAAHIDTKFCVAVNSGTTALRLALQALDIGQGHEVITTPLTFVATAAAIVQRGACPVFVDVDRETGNLDANQVSSRITAQTRAILPVHLYGQPAAMDRLRAIADRFHLHLIEDAAQAHGATFHHQRAGSLGDLACFSFYPGKNLGAAGEGGAVTTNNPAWANRLRQLRNHGQERRDVHLEIGENARMDEIQGIALNLQLPFLERWNKRRAQIAAEYRRGLADVPEIELPCCVGGHSYHQFVIHIEQRDELRRFLEDRQIWTRIHYPTLVPHQPAFAMFCRSHADFPFAERWVRRCLSLPIGPNLSWSLVKDVIAAIRDFCGSSPTPSVATTRRRPRKAK